MPVGYQLLPLVYDRWQETYGTDFSTLIFPKLLSTLKRYQIPSSSMVDLACGTGTLSLMMARRGWEVWGVDGSEGMISEARKKIRQSNLPVTFVRADIRSFRLPKKIALATSFFDSLNHLLSSRDLLRTFRRVFASLQPGGFFVFDVNNELCYTTLWNRPEAVHHAHFDIVLENSYDPQLKVACSRVTIFLRKGKLYERMCETVRERLFTPEELSHLLQRAGFHVLESEDFNFTADPIVGRIKTWCVARKEKG